MKHTSTTLPYPLNRLTRVSLKKAGHLELKNSSADLFFGLPNAMLGILGLVIYRWKGLKITFPTVYYTPQYAYKMPLQNKKENLWWCTDCRSR